MNQKERMLNGLPYKAWLDGLEEEREACKQLVYEFNLLPPKDRAEIPELLKKMLGKTGEKSQSGKTRRLRPMYPFIQQDTQYTRKAATLVMNTESLSRLAITYG